MDIYETYETYETYEIREINVKSNGKTYNIKWINFILL